MLHRLTATLIFSGVIVAPYALVAQDTTPKAPKPSSGEGISVMTDGPTGREGKDNAAVVLGDAKTFTTFLKLADRAKLTPVLTGAVIDSTQTPVTTTPPNTSEVTANINVPAQFRSLIKKQIEQQLALTWNKLQAQPGVMTIFAPTDAAFAKLPKKTLNAMLADSAKAAAVVRAHIVNRGIALRSFPHIERVQTLDGRTLPFTPKALGDAAFVGTDLTAGNALIHGIDKVLLPAASGNDAHP